MNNDFNNNFSQEPDKNYTTPIVIKPKTPEPEKKSKKTKGNGRVIAIAICCSIVFSSIFGIGGAYLTYNILAGETTEKPLVTTGGKNTNSDNPSVIYKTVTTDENPGTTATSSAIVNAAASAKHSVVEIRTSTVATNSFFGQYVTEGAGSGVILTEDGYIITCAHVVEGASGVTVTLANGEEYDAALIGTDSQTDIAVIKINVIGLSPAVIGDSDNLLVGEDAIAIGNPLGELGGSVSSGIISALDREIVIDGQTYSLLQTTAAINPGNSGGGLFNLNGELIGIVNAKSSGNYIEGLGFSIPINNAMSIAEQLINHGYIKGRPALGINVSEVNSATTSARIRNSDYPELIDYITDYGVYFLNYTENDVENSGLEFGDRIIAIDGISVSSFAAVRAVLSDNEYEVGDRITITVARLTDTGRFAQSKITEVEHSLVEYVPVAVG